MEHPDDPEVTFCAPHLRRSHSPKVAFEAFAKEISTKTEKFSLFRVFLSCMLDLKDYWKTKN